MSNNNSLPFNEPVGWGEARSPTIQQAFNMLGFASSPQPTTATRHPRMILSGIYVRKGNTA